MQKPEIRTKKSAKAFADLLVWQKAYQLLGHEYQKRT